MTLIERALTLSGELIISGLSGLELDDSSRTFLTNERIGGVILFGPNYHSPAQVAELINSIQECRHDQPLWVSVDHEGGRVQRFKTGFSRIPDASLQGDSDSPKTVYEVAEGMAHELKSVGINVNYAPVADIQTNPKNPVIGNRSFGTTEELVSKMVSAQVRGHLSAGIQPCLKHFPGHGDTSTDSHFALPKVDTTLETMKKREFKPFEKGHKSKAKMIMTAHIVCKAIDPELPATLSKKILTEILRGDLAYDGLIISDDMEMKAISSHFGKEISPVLAINAGCDLLIYRSQLEAELALKAIRIAIQSGKCSAERVIESAELSQKLKRETFPNYKPVKVQELTGKLLDPSFQKTLQLFNQKQ